MVAQIPLRRPATSTRPTPARAAQLAASQREAKLDAELVRRFNSGDQEAFVEIVVRYREKMRCVAFRLLRNHADAEEIAQDTFVRAYRSLALFRGESSLSAWLHSITLNLARNRYWYFYRRRRHTTQSIDATISTDTEATFADLIACKTLGPVQEASTQEFHELVAACMNKLRADQRRILILRNVREQSYEAIAVALGLKVGTVKSRIGRARRALRQAINKSYPEFDADASPCEWFDIPPTSGHQESICA